MELFDRSTSLFNNSSRKAKSFCPGCFVQTRIAGYNGPQQSQEMSAKQFTRKRNLHKFLPDKSTRFRGSVRHSLCCDRTTECCLLQACYSTGCEAPRSHHSESIKQFWHLSRSTRMQFTTSQQLSTITERRHQPSGREIEHDRKANSGANSPRLRRWKDTNCACQSELRSFLWFCTLKNKHRQFKKTIYVPSFHEGFSQAKQSWNLPQGTWWTVHDWSILNPHEFWLVNRRYVTRTSFAGEPHFAAPTAHQNMTMNCMTFAWLLFVRFKTGFHRTFR